MSSEAAPLLEPQLKIIHKIYLENLPAVSAEKGF
jgi:hypothetical protein